MKRLQNELYEDYRIRIKKEQKALKKRLLGKWFYLNNSHTEKQAIGFRYLPYIKPKTKPKVSFTEELRNKRGYGNFLNKKYHLKTA